MSAVEAVYQQMASACGDRDRFVVGIDGCGGAGKSTLASELAEMWKGSQVVHTDDFASWDHPLDWHERCLRELWSVLEKGETARFLATDWTKSGVERWVEVDPGRVIFEGVSSSCLAFSPFVDLKVWVKAPRELRLQRGLERDGEGARGLWEEWMREEDKYVAREDPAGRADLVVRGW